MIVRTVLGDVDPAELGATYAHEHFIIDSPMVANEIPEIHLPSVDEAVAEIERCTNAGVGAVVDAMPVGAGRDVVRLAQVSERSGVHIIAATGLHTTLYYREGSWEAEAGEGLGDRFVAEIEDGADGSEHRAGAIKVATFDTEITDRERRVFTAAASAHHRTGAPILTHTEGGLGGMEQVEMLGELGVGLERVALSHTDKVLDAAYHRDLLATGVSLVYDQALRQPSQDTESTSWLVEEMVAAGYTGQLMLGTDGARRSMWSTLGGEPGLDWLLIGFAEALDDRGVDAETRTTLFIDNPARFLSFEPA